MNGAIRAPDGSALQTILRLFGSSACDNVTLPIPIRKIRQLKTKTQLHWFCPEKLSLLVDELRLPCSSMINLEEKDEGTGKIAHRTGSNAVRNHAFSSAANQRSQTFQLV